MSRLAERPLADVLAQVAARRPAPGGGTSAALTCALAAGLVEMTAAFTRGDGEAGPAADDLAGAGVRAGRLREEALALAERELESYAPVIEAMRSGGDRDGRVADALARAAEPPLAIARAAAEVAELAARAAAGGNPNLRGDAVTGVLLAEAACRAAGHLVRQNLAGVPQDPRCEEALELATRGEAARRRALDER